MLTTRQPLLQFALPTLRRWPWNSELRELRLGPPAVRASRFFDFAGGVKHIHSHQAQMFFERVLYQCKAMEVIFTIEDDDPVADKLIRTLMAGASVSGGLKLDVTLSGPSSPVHAMSRRSGVDCLITHFASSHSRPYFRVIESWPVCASQLPHRT